MTDDEIYKECKKVWVDLTGWGWTHDEFMSLLGYLDDSEERTLNNGKVVTGNIVSYWFADWRSFSHGWISAYKYLGKDRRLGAVK